MRSGVPRRPVIVVDNLAELKRISTKRYAYHVAAVVTAYLRSRRSHFQASGKLNIPGRIYVPVRSASIVPVPELNHLIRLLARLHFEKASPMTYFSARWLHSMNQLLVCAAHYLIGSNACLFAARTILHPRRAESTA